MRKTLTLLIAILGIMVLTGVGCTTTEEETNDNQEGVEETVEKTDAEMMMETVVEDDMMMEVDEVMVGAMREPDYQNKGTLVAITDDAAKGPEKGIAWSAYDVEKKVYTLYATFDALPELNADEYFYEGWIVRKGTDMSVISTGAIEYDAKLGQWINKYQSEQDLTDHDFYVLTLEPNDDNPAPAAHVLEGTLNSVE